MYLCSARAGRAARARCSDTTQKVDLETWFVGISYVAGLVKAFIASREMGDSPRPSIASASGEVPYAAASGEVPYDHDRFGPSPSKRLRQKGPELFAEAELVLSPSKRHVGKQPASMHFVRNAKLCQKEDCVYNRAQPGRPAICRETTYCVWCDAPRADKAYFSSLYAIVVWGA